MTLEEKMKSVFAAYCVAFPGCKAASVHLILLKADDGQLCWRASSAVGVSVADTAESAVDGALASISKDLVDRLAEAQKALGMHKDAVEDLANKIRELELMGILPA